MTIQDKIGKSIIKLRRTRGFSQESFAFEAGIDRRYMSDIENGKRNPSVELLMRIVRYFDISLSTFFSITESIEGEQLTIQSLKEYLNEAASPETILFENPDYVHSIIGLSTDSRLVYSYDKMVEELMALDGMSYEEAVEFIDYNTIRALPYMGDLAPIIVYGI